ncbi:MAG: TraR/DksA family transcriptional regulator [Pseudomonadota bacterium]
MSKVDHFRQKILQRLDELGVRMGEIETELDQPKPRDLSDQAIDLEDDEVLETLGFAAQQETRMLRAALKRCDDGSFGICAVCDEPISEARLEVVPQTQLCRGCAAEVAAR